MSHRVELDKDARGNLVRIDNALAQMPERYKTVQGRLENVQAQLATAKAELGKPFAFLLKSQYWNATCRRKLFDEIPPSYILPLTWRPDFFFKKRMPGEKGSPLMDVMWCVWLTPWKNDIQTVYRPLTRPEMGE